MKKDLYIEHITDKKDIYLHMFYFNNEYRTSDLIIFNHNKEFESIKDIKDYVGVAHTMYTSIPLVKNSIEGLTYYAEGNAYTEFDLDNITDILVYKDEETNAIDHMDLLIKNNTVIILYARELRD